MVGAVVGNRNGIPWPRSAAALLMLVMGSCSAPSGPPISAVLDLMGSVETLEADSLGPGDQLAFTVHGTVVFREEALVEPDGQVAFAALGRRVLVTGLTMHEAAELVDQLADEAGVRGTVSLQLLAGGPKHVTILGEVERPGNYPIEPDDELTLQELLATAGGFERSSARLNSTVLVRWYPQSDREMSVTIDARPEQWTGERPMVLQPHDLVFVPQTTVDVVNIWLRQNLTLMLPLPGYFFYF